MTTRPLALTVVLAAACTAVGCGGDPAPPTPRAELQVPDIPPARKDDPNARRLPPRTPAKR